VLRPGCSACYSVGRIRIYREELGCGAAPQNHVLPYKQLLARYGCDQSVLYCMPRIGDLAEFHRRVGSGYQLNLVGMGTQQAIASFDPGQSRFLASGRPARLTAASALCRRKLHLSGCTLHRQQVSARRCMIAMWWGSLWGFRGETI